MPLNESERGILDLAFRQIQLAVETQNHAIRSLALGLLSRNEDSRVFIGHIRSMQTQLDETSSHIKGARENISKVTGIFDEG